VNKVFILRLYLTIIFSSAPLNPSIFIQIPQSNDAANRLKMGVEMEVRGVCIAESLVDPRSQIDMLNERIRRFNEVKTIDHEERPRRARARERCLSYGKIETDDDNDHQNDQVISTSVSSTDTVSESHTSDNTVIQNDLSSSTVQPRSRLLPSKMQFKKVVSLVLEHMETDVLFTSMTDDFDKVEDPPPTTTTTNEKVEEKSRSITLNDSHTDVSSQHGRNTSSTIYNVDVSHDGLWTKTSHKDCKKINITDGMKRRIVQEFIKTPPSRYKLTLTESDAITAFKGIHSYAFVKYNGGEFKPLSIHLAVPHNTVMVKRNGRFNKLDPSKFDILDMSKRNLDFLFESVEEAKETLDKAYKSYPIVLFVSKDQESKDLKSQAEMRSVVFLFDTKRHLDCFVETYCYIARRLDITYVIRDSKPAVVNRWKRLIKRTSK